MPDALPHVRVAENVTAESFRRDVLPGNVPVLLRGLVACWPAVAAGMDSDEAMAEYLCRFDNGKPAETLLGHPEIRGRFFYNERMDGLNFVKRPLPIRVSIERILEARGEPAPPSIYIQSAPIPEFLAGFPGENTLDLVDSSVVPRIWIGNRLTVQTHFDLRDNIACVVAGRRRFTMFPPWQTPNLYPGPFDLTLAGPPVSMVRLDEPDLSAYPRFRDALKDALVADLEPGDAIYVPYFWWHHVEVLDELNVLVNYWWNDAPSDPGSPYDALLHAILAIRDMPERQREAWLTMFECYVFGKYGDPVAHLPAEIRGPLGAHDSRMRRRMRLMLLESLARQAGLPPTAAGAVPGGRRKREP